MPTKHVSTTAPPYPPSGRRPEPTIARWAGLVYEAAPAAERCRLLERLMRPLGVLSLVGVANGAFVSVWFRSGWHDLRIRPDVARRVSVRDVVELVDYVQHTSPEAIDDLARLVGQSPMMASPAAAMLVQRAQTRKAYISDCPFRGT